jgi:hypothetical protein
VEHLRPHIPNKDCTHNQLLVDFKETLHLSSLAPHNMACSLNHFNPNPNPNHHHFTQLHKVTNHNLLISNLNNSVNPNPNPLFSHCRHYRCNNNQIDNHINKQTQLPHQQVPRQQVPHQLVKIIQQALIPMDMEKDVSIQ